MKKLSLLGMAMAILAGCGGSDDGGSNGPSISAVGVTTEGRLVAFDTRRPSRLLSDQAITGLGAGETVVGIDQRPVGGSIYAVSNTGRVYTLSAATGAAVAVGPDAVDVDATATASDIDFNPTVDRIRLGNATGDNIRINPDTGAQVDGDANTAGVQADTDFAYADASAIDVVGLAYDNSVAAATTTKLYAIDRAQDRLALVASPNNGVLTPIGPLGVDVVDYAPFDITPTNTAAIAAIGEGDRSRIARINLSTGAATSLGRTPVGLKLVAFAIVTPAAIP